MTAKSPRTGSDQAAIAAAGLESLAAAIRAGDVPAPDLVIVSRIYSPGEGRPDQTAVDYIDPTRGRGEFERRRWSAPRDADTLPYPDQDT